MSNVQERQTLISTPSEILELVEEIKNEKMISFDTEFIRETTFFPILEIIQIASEDKVWLVDAKAFQKKGKEKGLDPLFKVFSDPKVLKVVHAGQADQECLYTTFGKIAKPSLDTALAASLCGYGDGIGLRNLLDQCLNVRIKKGHARTNWSVRPLPAQLIEYAKTDVVHLVRLGKFLLDKLDQLHRRKWALDLSAQYEDQQQYEVNADAIVRRLFGNGRLDRDEYAVLGELVLWRETRTRELNVPRKWLAGDSILLDLARVKPKDRKHLNAFRGLNKGEVKKNGDKILQAIQKGMDHAKSIQLPKVKSKETPSLSEQRMVELLRCYLSILADQHEIALKQLISSDQYLILIRSPASSVEELVRAGALERHAASLVGEEILGFLQGKTALSLGPQAIHTHSLS